MPEIKEEDLKKDEQQDKKKKLNKGFEDILAKIESRKKYYEEKYAKSISLAKKDFAYARGEQWDEETLKSMKDEDGNLIKPAITQNLIKEHLDYLRGNQSQNRYYFKVLPADNVEPNEPVVYDGEQVNYDKLSYELTCELKKIENDNDGEYELDDCFFEAVSGSGRSNLEVLVKEDEEEFPRKKNILFEHRRYDQSYADPDHKKYDLSDSKDHIKLTELSREDLIALIPEKEEEIKQLTRHEEDLASKENKSDGNLKYTEVEADIGGNKADNTDLVLVEYFDYEWKKEYLLILPQTGQEPQKFGEDEHAKIKKQCEETEKEMQALGQPFEWLIVPLKRKCWYVTFYCSGVVLKRETLVVNGVELKRLPFCEYACDRLNSVDSIELRDLSVTRQLIGTQDIHNKAVSQLIAHLNSSIHSGIVAEQGILIDEENWEKFGSSAGFVGYVKQGGFEKWKQLTPTPISQGHTILMQLAQQMMPHISGINPNLTATSEKDESGRAKALQIRQGQTTTNYIYDNFRRTKHVLCAILLEHICALKGLEYKKLKIVVDDTSESPTARYANWQETKEVLESTGGLQTPFADLVIDMMNINNRDQWKERWMQVNEFAQFQAQKQQEAKMHEEQVALHNNPWNKAAAEKLAIQDAQSELGKNVDVQA